MDSIPERIIVPPPAEACTTGQPAFGQGVHDARDVTDRAACFHAEPEVGVQV